MNGRPNQEEDLFDQARRLIDPHERAEFLDQACGGDTALQQSVEELLSAQEEGDVLFRPLAELAQGRTADNRSSTEEPGAIIGRYRLLEKIGEGGFGIVYLAEQKEPVKRRVALKIIKLGMDTRQVVARFEAERQALALMDHPNIARVFDGGATDSGRPYFVMELVRGTLITQYCDAQRLTTRGRLGLFIQVCQAVQHAHQKGIIHRDLKPSNILITVNDGQAIPKVIDFGVAKATQQELTEKTIFTQFHQFIGTPAYMSPEQAELTSVDIDTRSDIYSLGVLLYELLTGKTPFDGKELLASGLDQLRRTIRERDPARPSTCLNTMPALDRTTTARLRGAEPRQLVRLLQGDLDWIVMKCLEKDRRRRYETANGLAMDLKRYLGNEPVVARPPSTIYRFQKLVRRNRAASVAGGLVALAVLAGGFVSGWALLRERAARREANGRLRAALGFVQQVLDEAAPQIESVAGAAKAYNTLGEASLRFVKQLRPSAADDPALRATLARALVFSSGAQNPGGANTVGDYETGLQLAEEAADLLTNNSIALDSTERLRLLYRARFARVQCLYALGRNLEAVALTDDLEPLINNMEEVPKLAGWARRERMNTRANAALALLLAGKTGEAIERHRMLLESDWVKSITTNSDANELEICANLNDNLATVYGLLNQFDAMLPFTDEGMRWWDIMVGKDPKNARYLVGRATSRAQQGYALTCTGGTNQGLAALRKARQEIEELNAQDSANDQFLQTRAMIAAIQSSALARWSTEPMAPMAQRRQRLIQAEKFLAEAEQFFREAKSKLPQLFVDAARSETAKAKTAFEQSSSDPAPTDISR